MPVIRTYQCPDCEGYFDHLHMRSTEEPPNRCVLCGADMTGTAPELSAPHVAKSIGKVADNVYRAMEDSSAHRAELAAEALGESAADMGAMRITNMRDNAREGETSVAAVSNPVSTFMAQTGAGGHMDQSTAAEYAKSTRVGPYAGAGVSAMQGVVQQHAAVAPRVAAAGNLGKH